ncbi:MAG: type II toxin-antitoxin system VapC family toxin [Beijerinckiaceae bacterium]|nr:type II toxin-antitoxin system VapC family toxin [Beijerinckiaceae bacterium]
MKITADTSILVRAITGDEPRQAARAQSELANAEAVAVPLPVLCELVWVLSQGYGIPTTDIADAVRRLIHGATVSIDKAAAEAGLMHLEAGGDFADGVIAYEGRRLGAAIFVSFDKKAVTLLEKRGFLARLA